VGGGERISINAVYAEIARLLGSDLNAEHMPARDGDVRDSLAAIDRARVLLGYVPRVGWRQGLATTIEWYRRRASSLSA
jgi:UDP-glucose 4-epimerase